MTESSDELKATTQKEQAFALVDTLLEVTCDTPVEIIPHHNLRRASPDEIERIRATLLRWGDAAGLKTLSYESVFKRNVGDSLLASRSEDAALWNYWVVGVGWDYSGAINGGIAAIEEASRIAAVELSFRFYFFPPEGHKSGFVSGDHMLMGSSLFGTDFFSRPRQFGQADLGELQALCNRLPDVKASNEKLRLAIATYLRLRHIPRHEPLYVLGVFAVIESLLTHDPHGDYDSLGHQVKTKMWLLNRRFKSPLDYSQFRGADPKTIWSKLYSFRSCIAHGNQPNFSKDLRSLQTPAIATEFLDTAAKAVLKHALDEPDLISDLQAC